MKVSDAEKLLLSKTLSDVDSFCPIGVTVYVFSIQPASGQSDANWPNMFRCI